jgi:hypothetical protein
VGGGVPVHVIHNIHERNTAIVPALDLTTESLMVRRDTWENAFMILFCGRTIHSIKFTICTIYLTPLKFFYNYIEMARTCSMRGGNEKCQSFFEQKQYVKGYSSRMLRLVVWYILTDVPEVPP